MQSSKNSSRQSDTDVTILPLVKYLKHNCESNTYKVLLVNNLLKEL